MQAGINFDSVTFDWLNDVPAEDALDILRGHASVLRAIAMSCMSDEKAVELMELLPEKDQVTLALEIFHLPKISQQSAALLSLCLKGHRENGPAQAVFNARSKTVDLITLMSPKQKGRLLREMVKESPATADFIKSKLPDLECRANYPEVTIAVPIESLDPKPDSLEEAGWKHLGRRERELQKDADLVFIYDSERAKVMKNRDGATGIAPQSEVMLKGCRAIPFPIED